MRGKIVVLGVFLLSVLTFGKINDGIDLFTAEEETKLEEKIEEISQRRGLSLYVNSFSGEEGFVVDKAEKLVVLNIIKPSEEKIKIELKLTKDMELDDFQENIDGILIGNENLLKEKKFYDYSKEILTEIDEILENVKIEEPIVVEEEIVVEQKNSFFIGMGIAFFVIFGIIVRVLMLKYKKSLKEEIDIISRKR